jgi:type II secretory pathway pseudopilin PulG
MRTRRNQRAGGFTLIEIMVSLAVVIIGLLGIMALQTTTVRANRLSRNIERASVLAAQLMEVLRAKPMPLPAAWCSAPNYVPPDGVTSTLTPDGVPYLRSCRVDGVTGSTTLLLLTATVSFIDPTDQSPHSAVLQLVRTNAGENL